MRLYKDGSHFTSFQIRINSVDIIETKSMFYCLRRSFLTVHMVVE